MRRAIGALWSATIALGGGMGCKYRRCPRTGQRGFVCGGPGVLNSGTATKPVLQRGARWDGVILDAGNCTAVECLTIRNTQQGQLDTVIADNVWLGWLLGWLLGWSGPLSNAYGMQMFGRGAVVMHNRVTQSGDRFDDGIEVDTAAGGRAETRL